MSGTRPATAAKPTTGTPDDKNLQPAPLPSRPPATDVKVGLWEFLADSATLARVKRALERL